MGVMVWYMKFFCKFKYSVDIGFIYSYLFFYMVIIFFKVYIYIVYKIFIIEYKLIYNFIIYK